MLESKLWYLLDDPREFGGNLELSKIERRYCNVLSHLYFMFKQLKTVIKIRCPRCGELQLKIYPNSSFLFDGLLVDQYLKLKKSPLCIKCLKKNESI